MKGYIMKKSQKLRVIVNGVSFYTTAGQIRCNVGDSIRINEAVLTCLLALTNQRKTADYAVGLAGRWNNVDVQLDIL
jgi:hypothetical protein